MCRKRLEKIFCWKLSGELKIFKYRILRMRNEEIYKAAYEIDSTICIYELLMEMSAKISDEALKAGIAFPAVLSFLYGRWLKYEDSHTEELQDCLEKELKRIHDSHKKGEEGEDAA